MELNNKEELLEEFEEVLRELMQVTAKDEIFTWGNFLWDLVRKYVDEETLAKMIADTRIYINLRITEYDKLKSF